MPSPFPGMDPFLEDPAFWSDFHSTFINNWREAIADVLPREYEASIGRRHYLIEQCQPLVINAISSSSDSVGGEQMKSPFPGMDPFLEGPAYWSDFHSRFVNYWCEGVADALPPNYEASIGERVYLMGDDPGTQKQIEADVAVSHERDFRNGGSAATATLTALEPVTMPLELLDGPREPYIEILHQPERSLVAALELLSPSNKERPGRTQYLVKRQALIFQDVHLIELDLLRGGQRLPMAKPLPPGDCYYFLARAGQRPDCDVYTWTYKHRLPTLPIPLRSPDADIAVDLAAVFDTAYDRGRFGRRLRYDKETLTHMNADEQSWALSLLKKES